MINETIVNKLARRLPDVWPLTATGKYLADIICPRTIRNSIQRGTGPEHVRSKGTGGKIILERDSFIEWFSKRIEGK